MDRQMRARLLLVMVMTVGAGAVEDQTRGGTVKLRYASGFAAVSPYEAEGSRFWMKRVTELTKDQVQFEYYPAGQLAKPDKMLTLAASGVADVAMVTVNLEADKFPLIGM